MRLKLRTDHPLTLYSCCVNGAEIKAKKKKKRTSVKIHLTLTSRVFLFLLCFFGFRRIGLKNRHHKDQWHFGLPQIASFFEIEREFGRHVVFVWFCNPNPLTPWCPHLPYSVSRVKEKRRQHNIVVWLVSSP